MVCLNCGEKVVQTPGKRERLYCNSTCRSNFWQKEKRKDNIKPSPPIPNPKTKKILTERNKAIKIPNAKYPLSHSECIEPPPGLKGIDLSIWKAEQKTKNENNGR